MRKTLEDLTAAWRDASTALDRIEISLGARYGSLSSARAYAKRKVQAPWDKARERDRKAREAVYAWLTTRSPWDWQSGVSCRWTRDNVTTALAMSDTAPMIPADGASWGMPHEPFVLARVLSECPVCEQRFEPHGCNTAACSDACERIAQERGQE